MIVPPGGRYAARPPTQPIRVLVLQFCNLSRRAPLRITSPSFGEQYGGDLSLPAAEPEAGAKFVCQSPVLEHAGVFSVTDGALIKVERREFAARDAIKRASDETGLPATDPVRFDPAPLVTAIERAADQA